VVDVGSDAAVLGANKEDDEVRTATVSTTVAVVSSNLRWVLAEDRLEATSAAELRARIAMVSGCFGEGKRARERRGGRGFYRRLGVEKGLGLKGRVVHRRVQDERVLEEDSSPRLMTT
jgi:hypothetical protein